MKKIILFLLLPLLSFSQEKTVESFFKEYNYNCENYNGEDLYEFFGFDIEDDVTPALEAINSFCENGSGSNKNESFIIATNVNVRNLPSLEKGGEEGNCINNDNKSSPCTRHLELVCGCDGLTYSNPCVATNHGVNFYTAGACSD